MRDPNTSNFSDNKTALSNIKSLNDQQKELLTKLVEKLSIVPGIEAIALGGSHATGRANVSSDIDLGIYYREGKEFAIDDLVQLTDYFRWDKDAVFVGFYEWGPWVNGGAWLQTEIGKVDIIYRNLNQVENTIDQAHQGIWENHYQQQPPYGFTSMIYLAELLACVPLFDPQEILKILKLKVANYPEKLRKEVVNTSLWSAEFTIAHMDGLVEKGDLYSLMGCLTRSLKNIVEALFALNSLYPISDKFAVQILSQQAGSPSNFLEKVNSVLDLNPKSPTKNVEKIKELFNEVLEIAGGLYQPKFRFSK